MPPIVFELTFDQATCDMQAAWSAWTAASCIERHGGHLWHLYLLHPEEDSEWGIACDYCGTSTWDEYGDMAEFPEGNIHGIELYDTLGDPRHNAGRKGHVPITVTTWSHYYSSPNGHEWDFGLTISPLGPVEWEDDCCHPNPEGTPCSPSSPRSCSSSADAPPAPPYAASHAATPTCAAPAP